MPRIKQNAEKYVTSDFLRELRVRMAYLNIPHVQDLANAAGIPTSTMAGKWKAPDKLNVCQLRKIVKTLEPSPTEVLKFLGYGGKAVKTFKEETNEERKVSQAEPPEAESPEPGPYPGTGTEA